MSTDPKELVVGETYEIALTVSGPIPIAAVQFIRYIDHEGHRLAHFELEARGSDAQTVPYLGVDVDSIASCQPVSSHQDDPPGGMHSEDT